MPGHCSYCTRVRTSLFLHTNTYYLLKRHLTISNCIAISNNYWIKSMLNITFNLLIQIRISTNLGAEDPL